MRERCRFFLETKGVHDGSHDAMVVPKAATSHGEPDSWMLVFAGRRKSLAKAPIVPRLPLRESCSAAGRDVRSTQGTLIGATHTSSWESRRSRLIRELEEQGEDAQRTFGRRTSHHAQRAEHVQGGSAWRRRDMSRDTADRTSLAVDVAAGHENSKRLSS